MSKGLSLLFAVLSIILMTATAISISNSLWLTLIFGILTLCMIGSGFIVKARLRRKQENKS